MKVLFRTFLFIGLAVFITGCEVERPKQPLNLENLNWGMEASLAVDEAERVYQESVQEGLDLTNGPCLSNHLFGNADYPETIWVLDIAHEPRSKADDLSENQCSAYKEGKAHNFIEMSPEGELLKVYSPYVK